MNIEQCFLNNPALLMEGAIQERLKREYALAFDPVLRYAHLVHSTTGRRALAEIWCQYSGIARRYRLPFLAATPTRRLTRELLESAGRSLSLLHDNVCFLQQLKKRSRLEMYAGALMGCRGDAYTGEGALPEPEAHRFHREQAELFKEAGADYLYAALLPTLPEAVGAARAIAGTSLPYLIGFTIQSDGCLIDGTAIHQAIAAIDRATRASKQPLCYMACCVHPTIVYAALSQPFNRTDLVRTRFSGMQANTSALPYSELDGAADLKTSDPEQLAAGVLRLKREMNLKILGGCCGSDQRHLEAIARQITDFINNESAASTH